MICSFNKIEQLLCATLCFVLWTYHSKQDRHAPFYQGANNLEGEKYITALVLDYCMTNDPQLSDLK